VITAYSLVHRPTADIYEGNLQKNTSTEHTGDSLGAGQTLVRYTKTTQDYCKAYVFLNKIVTDTCTWMNSLKERAKG